MRRGLALIWLGATTIIAAIVGFLSYQAGWAAGVATRVPGGAAVPGYYYAPHFFGFGFGLLPFLFLLFVVLLVLRGGRRRGPWGWGGGGWGPGYGGYDRFPGTTRPPAGDPLHDWPQRPSDEPAAPGQRQG